MYYISSSAASWMTKGKYTRVNCLRTINKIFKGKPQWTKFFSHVQMFYATSFLWYWLKWHRLCFWLCFWSHQCHSHNSKKRKNVKILTLHTVQHFQLTFPPNIRSMTKLATMNNINKTLNTSTTKFPCEPCNSGYFMSNATPTKQPPISNIKHISYSFNQNKPPQIGKLKAKSNTLLG